MFLVEVFTVPVYYPFECHLSMTYGIFKSRE